MPTRIMIIDPNIPTVSTVMAIRSSISDIPRSPRLARYRARPDRIFGDSDISWSSVSLYPIASAVGGPNLHPSARVDHDRTPTDISRDRRSRQKHDEALTRSLRADVPGYHTRKSARVEGRRRSTRVDGEIQAGDEVSFVRGAAADSRVNG